MKRTHTERRDWMRLHISVGQQARLEAQHQGFTLPQCAKTERLEFWCHQRTDDAKFLLYDEKRLIAQRAVLIPHLEEA